MYSHLYPSKSSQSSQHCHQNSRYKMCLKSVQNRASSSLGSFLNLVLLVIQVFLPDFHFRSIHTTASGNAFCFQVLVSCKAWVKLGRCRYQERNERQYLHHPKEEKTVECHTVTAEIHCVNFPYFKTSFFCSLYNILHHFTISIHKHLSCVAE